jgi:hypothetical protein
MMFPYLASNPAPPPPTILLSSVTTIITTTTTTTLLLLMGTDRRGKSGFPLGFLEKSKKI